MGGGGPFQRFVSCKKMQGEKSLKVIGKCGQNIQRPPLQKKTKKQNNKNPQNTQRSLYLPFHKESFPSFICKRVLCGKKKGCRTKRDFPNRVRSWKIHFWNLKNKTNHHNSCFATLWKKSAFKIGVFERQITHHYSAFHERIQKGRLYCEFFCKKDFPFQKGKKLTKNSQVGTHSGTPRALPNVSKFVKPKAFQFKILPIWTFHIGLHIMTRKKKKKKNNLLTKKNIFVAQGDVGRNFWFEKKKEKNLRKKICTSHPRLGKDLPLGGAFSKICQRKNRLVFFFFFPFVSPPHMLNVLQSGGIPKKAFIRGDIPQPFGTFSFPNNLRGFSNVSFSPKKTSVVKGIGLSISQKRPKTIFNLTTFLLSKNNKQISWFSLLMDFPTPPPPKCLCLGDEALLAP